MKPLEINDELYRTGSTEVELNGECDSAEVKQLCEAQGFKFVTAAYRQQVIQDDMGNIWSEPIYPDATNIYQKDGKYWIAAVTVHGTWVHKTTMKSLVKTSLKAALKY